eukprot:scaffold287224_cov27-Tisochrysis_lutea.AAC.2
MTACCRSIHWSQSAQWREKTSVRESPTTTSPRRARVSMTFSRRASETNPRWPARLQRTAEKSMSSFSLP